jgi:hypothetical protein
VDVVFAENALEYLNIERLTGLVDQLSNFQSKIPSQHVITILRDEHKVVLNLKNRVAIIPIVHLFHRASQKASKINLTA